MTLGEIITRYYQALDDHDDERAYACLTRRLLTDFLFSNMGDLALHLLSAIRQMTAALPA